VGGDLAAPGNDSGIDDSLGAASVFVPHDHQAERDSDLGRGQPDPDLVVHGLHHVVDDVLDLWRDFWNRLGLPTERRIAVFSDLQNCHSTGSTSTLMIPRLAEAAGRSCSPASRAAGRVSDPFTTTRQARTARPGAGG